MAGAGIVINGNTTTPATALSNYLGAFATVNEIQALSKKAGNEADLLRDGETDQRWFYDSSDDSWRPYGDGDFKGYFKDLAAVKVAFPDPLTTWRGTSTDRRELNFVVFQGEWIEEPTTLDASYVQLLINNEVNNLPSPEIVVGDKDGIEQFRGQQINFENASSIDPVKGKVVLNYPAFNFIMEGGVNDITTLELFSTLFLEIDGSSLNPVSKYIKNFKITGNIITALFINKVGFNGKFRPNTLGKNVTKIIDLQGFIIKFGFQDFINNNIIKELFLPEIKGTTSFNIRNCINLEKVTITNIDSLDLSGCNSLTELYAQNAKILVSLYSCPINIGFDINFIKQINGQSVFRGLQVQRLNLKYLTTISGNRITENSIINEFRAENLKSINGSAFHNDLYIKKLEFENLERVNPSGVTAHVFAMNSIELIFIPRCKVFGSDSVDNDFYRGKNLSKCTIVINEHLRTSNNGGINANLQRAIQLGATVVFATDYNQSFQEEQINITSTYLNDAAAAIGNIKIGQRYVSTDGIVKVRLN